MLNIVDKTKESFSLESVLQNLTVRAYLKRVYGILSQTLKNAVKIYRR